MKPIPLVFLAWLALSAPACRRDPTLLVRNMSGSRLEVRVEEGQDVLVRDTVGVGLSWCWAVPEFARRDSVTVWLMYIDSKTLAGTEDVVVIPLSGIVRRDGWVSGLEALDSGDDRGAVCKDYSEWVQAWTEIKG